MNNHPEFAELPELAIFHICEHLSYEDLLNLRVTCKRLKAVLDQRPSPLFRTLHLFVAEYPFEQELFHTGELVSHANTWRLRNLDILNSTKFKNQFAELRKLTTRPVCRARRHNFPQSKGLKLSDLNYFQELVYLEFQWYAKACNVKGKLSLRNLRIATFENINPDYDCTDYYLECPQLQVLGLANKTRIWPTDETCESIRHLYVNNTIGTQNYLYLSRARAAPEPIPYEQLNNVSTISFRLFDDLNRLNRFLVGVIGPGKRLPSLKRIIWKKGVGVSGEMLRNLLDLKRRPETKHIEFQINGKIMDISELTEMLELLGQISPGEPFYVRKGDGYLLKCFAENPILHCLIPGVFQLRLYSSKDVTLGKQLIEKLKELMELEIVLGEGTVVDKEFFELTLRTCRKLQSLYIKGAWLKQEQLDQIPNYFQNLSVLEFEYKFGLGKLKFDFATKLKNLYRIQFNFEIDREMMSLLLKNCHYQSDFHLYFRGKQTIWVYGQPNKNGRFQIKCSGLWGSSSRTDEFNSIEKAIEHYYWNDLFNTPFKEQANCFLI